MSIGQYRRASQLRRGCRPYGSSVTGHGERAQTDGSTAGHPLAASVRQLHQTDESADAPHQTRGVRKKEVARQLSLLLPPPVSPAGPPRLWPKRRPEKASDTDLRWPPL
jgi:hypothetical protein